MVAVRASRSGVLVALVTPDPLGPLADEDGSVVEEGEPQRAQRHAVRPVAGVRTRGVEEIGVPLWNGR